MFNLPLPLFAVGVCMQQPKAEVYGCLVCPKVREGKGANTCHTERRCDYLTLCTQSFHYKCYVIKNISRYEYCPRTNTIGLKILRENPRVLEAEKVSSVKNDVLPHVRQPNLHGSVK